MSSAATKHAIERAESRASILTNLSNKYAPSSSSSNATATTSSKHPPTTAAAKDDVNARVLRSITQFIDDPRDRAFRTISDAIVGKSIVLANTKAQSDATKAAKRVQSQQKAHAARRASKKTLKKAGVLVDPSAPSAAAPTERDLAVLHRLWATYVVRVMAECKGEAQLQGRCVCVCVGWW